MTKSSLLTESKNRHVDIHIYIYIHIYLFIYIYIYHILYIHITTVYYIYSFWSFAKPTFFSMVKCRKRLQTPLPFGLRREPKLLATSEGGLYLVGGLGPRRTGLAGSLKDVDINADYHRYLIMITIYIYIYINIHKST